MPWRRDVHFLRDWAPIREIGVLLGPVVALLREAAILARVVGDLLTRVTASEVATFDLSHRVMPVKLMFRDLIARGVLREVA